VLSSLGIYSVTPGKTKWETTIPYFKKAKIIFENKNQYKITRKKIKKLFPKKINNVALEKKFNLIPVPIIDAESKSFKDELKFKLLNPKSINYTIYNDLKIYCRIIDEKYKNSPFYL
jgi:putative alpha-1,2-mannosidase